MSSKTKSQLRTENNSSFPNNNSQFITPELLRTFNEDIIDSMVSNEDSGSFTVDSGSLLTTASFDNGTRDMTFTKGDGSTFDVNIPDASGSVIDTGSLLTTASAEFSTITFTKGDGSTFEVEATPRQVFETVKNKEGYTLPKGTPVYASGSTGNAVHVFAASASRDDRMPAAYVLNQELTSDGEGNGLLLGFINGVDTSAFASGDVIYVGANGGYTNQKPTGSNQIQNLGKVIVSDATNGSGVISGAGRSNDLPNITEGYAWVGDSNGVPQTVATSSFAGSSAFPFTGSAEISGSLTIQDTLKVANGNTTASLTAETELVEFLFKQNTFNSQTLITQDDGNGGQQFQQSKPGVVQNTLGFNGTSGNTFLQLTNGLTDGTVRMDDTAFKIINQSGSVDRQLILAAKSSDIGLSGDEPCIAIVSPSTEVEIFRFQNASTYTDGTVAVLTPLSSSTDISSNTVITNELTASLQEGYVFVGNSSGKTSEIQTSSLQTSIPSGTVSGSDQLTGSYDARYFQLNANNTADGDNIFSGSIETAAGTSILFNAQGLAPAFGRQTLWEFPKYSNLDGRGYNMDVANFGIYGNNTNNEFAAPASFDFETSGSNFAGESRASFGPLAHALVVSEGVGGQNANIKLTLDDANNASLNVGGSNVSFMTNPAVQSAEIGNPASTVPIYMQQQFVFANPGDGYATPLTINIDGSLTASADISSSASIHGNQFIGGTVTASLQEGYVWVGDSTNTTTTVATSSFGGGGGGGFPFDGDAQISGSLGVTGSINNYVNTLTVTSQTASVNFSDGNMFTLTLASGTDTHLDPTNIKAGQTVNIQITQPVSSGSISFAPSVKFAGGYPFTATTTGSAVDMLTMISYDGTSVLATGIKNFS